MLNGKNAYPSFSAGRLYFGHDKFKWVSLFTVLILLADAVLHLHALEKLRRLIVRKLLQRFYVAPVS